jgi:phage gp45-like
LTNSEAEAVIGFINGNRDLGIVLCVHDRSKRPTDLSSGDVCMYHHSDRDSTYRLQFKNAGVAELTTPKAVNINVTDSSFGEINLVSAKNINAEATTLIDINCTIDVNIGDTGGTLQKLLTKIAMDTYNSHTHNETGGITNVPNQQMVEDTDTTIITKAN